MGLLDIFRKSSNNPDSVAAPQRQHVLRPHEEIKQSRFGNKKGGWLDTRPGTTFDYTQIRDRARIIYRDSTIAHGIVQRLVDNVVNTGLTWESTPIWDLLPEAPQDDTARYSLKQKSEHLFQIYSGSKESDIEGKLTFSQIQRLIERLKLVDGEVFIILRYLNSPNRTSPIALQILRPDQVMNPDGRSIAKINGNGGYIYEGIEYDSTGKQQAIWVAEEVGWTPVRVPFYGPRSGRRFVIHYANIESAGQARGYPELESLAYELDRLIEYDMAELDAAAAAGVMLGSVESDKDAMPGKGPKLNPAIAPRATENNGPQPGIEQVEVNRRSIFFNNMEPGYTMKFFQPTRPNPNYAAFVEAFESRLGGALGMPRSVLVQQFQSSYSAARAEIKFFWHTVDRRRDDFVSGFLNPLLEAWMSEHVRQGNIQAHGFFDRIRHHAWLCGSWDGISMPQIDPAKEVRAVKDRLILGHTTGEREAKNYNGSDYRSNIERLKTENELRANANSAILDTAEQAEVIDSE